MQSKKNQTALIQMIVSVLIFGTVGVFRRYIPISSGLLACIRGIGGGLFILVFCLLSKKKIRHGLAGKTIGLLILTGAMIGVNWIALFEAFNFTSVPTATLFYYMQPTFVVILSPIFLKESISVKKGICALLALAGMVFVSGFVENGMPQGGELKGILLALLAAILYASVVMINKKMPGLDPNEKTMIQLVSAGIILIPYVCMTEDLMAVAWDPKTIVLILVVTFIHTGIAYVLFFGSMDALKGQTIAILSYLDPIFALILSSIIFPEERLSLWGIIGAALILGAAFVSETNLSITKRKSHHE